MGNELGKHGYFWLSYFDSSGAKKGTSFCHAVGPATYNRIYSYDTFGDVGQLSVSYAFNAFTPTASDKLASVQFWTEADDASYTIKIYDNFSGGALSTVLATATGTATYAGYHTIDLPSPLQLTAGDSFYVYLNITNGGSYPMAMDRAWAGYTSNSTANPGESYYSTNGTSWADLTTFDATANFCIKALTIPTTTPVSVAVSPASVVENGTTNLTYTLTRTATTFEALTVNFSLSGTADDATDYTVSGTGVTYNAATNTGTLFIPNGAATANVIIDPTGDTTIESNETVVATITSGSGYTISAPSTAAGTIANDDIPTPPQTLLTAGNVAIAGGTAYTFTVRYTDEQAVKYSTLDGGDVVVQRPSGSNLAATLLSVDKASDNPVLTATYRITPPNGSWGIADNGTYTVLMQSNQVSDTSNYFIAAGSLGTFLVGIAAVPTNFAAIGHTTNSITWSWNDNSNNESGFHGYDGAGVLKWNALAGQSSGIEYGFSVNTQYTRYVSVYTTAGEGGSSNTVSHYTSIEAAAGPLFGTIAHNSISVQSASVPSNLTAGNSGLIIRNTVAGTNSLWHQNNSVWTSAGLSANTAYSFTVQSRNGDRDLTAASSPATKWTLPAAPSASCNYSTGSPAAERRNGFFVYECRRLGRRRGASL